MQNINDMLRDLASRSGYRTYLEHEEPCPAAIVEAAQNLGLISNYMSGGMASTDMVIELTTAGRKHVRMPPRFEWLRRLFVRRRRA